MIESPEEFLDEEPELYEQDGPGLFDDPDAMTADTAGRTPTAGDSVGHDPRRRQESENPTRMRASPRVRTRREHPTRSKPHRPSAGANDLVTSPQGGPSPRVPRRRSRCTGATDLETFDEVIGQGHVNKPLQRALTNNKVNHAHLFSGLAGAVRPRRPASSPGRWNGVQGPHLGPVVSATPASASAGAGPERST